MNRINRLALPMLALSAMTLAATAKAQYIVQTIDFPNPGAEGGTVVAGINNSREISGSYYNADYSSGPVFTYANGVFIPSLPPNNTFSNTWGINNAGQVVGALFFPAPANEEDVRGFIKTGADYQIVSFPGSSDSAVTAINDAGTMALGWFEGADGHFHGFSYDVAAKSFTQIDTPGNVTTFLWGMNEAGVQVGVASGGKAILIENGVVKEFKRPGASSTYFYDINNNGVIVGDSDLGNFVFANGVYTSFDIPGADLLSIHSLNDAGDLAGYYTDSSGLYHGFVATAVPEPGAIVLLVGLTVSSAAFLRQRQKIRR